jgi:hypothetical protein
MENYKKLFANIEPILTPKGLNTAILTRIESEKKHTAKIRLWYTSFVSILSLIASVPAIQYFVTEFAKSGFYQYISLIFSDGGSMFLYWKELLLSLAESIPVLSTIAVLAIILVLLESIKYIVKDTRIVFNNKLKLV